MFDIPTQQAGQRWIEDGKRRLKVSKWMDYYYNSVREHLERAINGMIDSPAERAELKKYIEHRPIVGQIAARLAKLTKDAPTIKPDQAELAESYDALWQRLKLYRKLFEVEKFLTVTFDVAVMVNEGRGKELRLDIVTPDRAWVEQDPEDQTRATKFYFAVAGRVDSLRPGVITRCRWWDEDGWLWQGEVMANGQVDPRTVERLIDRPLGIMPVAMFRAWEPLDTFWHPGENPLVDTNQVIDLRYTDKQLTESYNAPQLLTKGIPDNQTLRTGRTARINIPKSSVTGEVEGDATFISPGADLTALQTTIDQRAEAVSAESGLSQSALKGTSVTSGYQLALGEAGVLELVNQRREGFRASLRELCEIINRAALAWVPQAYRGLSANTEFTIDFVELKFMETPMERVTRQQAEIAAGLKNVVDCVLEINPDLTREQAMAEFTAKMAENKQLAGSSEIESIMREMSGGDNGDQQADTDTQS